jgi:glutamine synthetase
MHTQRFQALQRATNWTVSKTTSMSSEKIVDFFGVNSFGLSQMREKLPKEAHQDLLKALDFGKKISLETAEAIALAAKEWAVGLGATHFCHWFQPLTGLTAEKHDAFISIQNSNHSELYVIERLSGSQLIQGEPDASSFPNGGMRSTFEARGYTAWDPSSQLFLMEDGNTKTLCIPSVFFGYHGQSLDMKTPLLRSTEILSQTACEFLKLLGDVDVKRVTCTLGAEQEYFLIDHNFVTLRPDLYMTGRTLLGSKSARGQQFEDHYFGAIPTRVKNFMSEVEYELYKLGIPIKTRHNEVAPSQFEVAPIFEDLNIAVDHNLLTMETLRRVARKHGLICLFHEKPFAGVNGSGKHCNWSMANDKCENLLEPGHTPHQNLRFLAILSVVLRAVYEHSDMLRASIASAGNDHRLGANEAPPAIISVFLGGLLDEILDSIEQDRTLKATAKQIIDLGVSKIPNISKDYTDRNRTSPFAFTGNKFEFRAVGASANPSYPMMILNAAVADAFIKSTEELKRLISQESNRDNAILTFIRQSISGTKAVRFSGNGYSEEWKLEAKKRGLPVAKNSIEAFKFFKDLQRTQFLIDTKVLSKAEIESHHHIFLEKYVKSLELETRVLLEIVISNIIPTLEETITSGFRTQSVIQNDTLSHALDKHQQIKESILLRLYQESEKLNSILKSLQDLDSDIQKAHMIGQDLIPTLDELRALCDQAEAVIPDSKWSLPKYREMLLTLGSC